MKPYLIGIDPGVTTGLAVHDRTTRRLVLVESMTILQAMDRVRSLVDSGAVHMAVYEDARLRTWFGAKGREALQGAGSIKRDCVIWSEFLGGLGIAFKAVKPQAGGTKWSAAQFAKLTGWSGRTNEHARDAAMLVFGMK